MPVYKPIVHTKNIVKHFSNLLNNSKVYHLGHKSKIISFLDMTSIIESKQKQQVSPLSNWTNKTKPYVICGPSGSGKTTLMQMLFEKYKDCFTFCVSHTTRKIRVNEVQDKSYHFIDMETFEKMIANNEFIEYSRFSENLYGTSFRELENVHNSGKIAILDLDIRGVISLKNAKFNAKYMFITSPTLDHLEQNLRKRGSENDVTLKTRLTHAIEDTKTAQDITFDFVIVNTDLVVAFEQLTQAVAEDVQRLKEFRNFSKKITEPKFNIKTKEFSKKFDTKKDESIKNENKNTDHPKEAIRANSNNNTLGKLDSKEADKISEPVKKTFKEQEKKLN